MARYQGIDRGMINALRQALMAQDGDPDGYSRAIDASFPTAIEMPQDPRMMNTEGSARFGSALQGRVGGGGRGRFMRGDGGGGQARGNGPRAFRWRGRTYMPGERIARQRALPVAASPIVAAPPVDPVLPTDGLNVRNQFFNDPYLEQDYFNNSNQQQQLDTNYNVNTNMDMLPPVGAGLSRTKLGGQLCSGPECDQLSPGDGANSMLRAPAYNSGAASFMSGEYPGLRDTGGMDPLVDDTSSQLGPIASNLKRTKLTPGYVDMLSTKRRMNNMQRAPNLYK